MQSRRITPATALGIALGVLLLANSVGEYRRASARLMVEQSRKNLAAQAATVGKLVQAAGADAELLDEVRAASRGRIAWIHTHAGAPSANARFETRTTANGPVLVETFSVQPKRSKRFAVQLAAYQPAATATVVEIAAYMSVPSEDLWPLRRNLLINGLIALGFIGLQLRRHLQ